MTPAEQIALWADKLRDMSASGLKYAENIYDRERYAAIQQIAIEMLALATGQSVEAIEPLRGPIFSRPTPLVAGIGAVIDPDARILLMRRSDNGLWGLPGGALEVGETAAAGAAREVLEETGVRCDPVALVGIYDSLRAGGPASGQHIYNITFLCRPRPGEQVAALSHAHETLETGWFAEDALPPELWPRHVPRVRDAFRVWRGEHIAQFDR
jgi:ADP-ribose pyrophosphatase YjhB (NUDIX family)